MKKQLVSLVTILFVLFVGKLFISSAPDQKYTSLKASEILPEALPDHISFCNERTPLEKKQLKNKFDTELGIYVTYKVQTIMLMREAKAHFSTIEPILKKHGIPADFKYLPIIESGFTQQVSSKGAAGPWQFMPATARKFGLEVNAEVDERYHLEKSTNAACKYLKEAHRSFKDWTLVAASYNCGIPGLKAKVAREGKNSYYELHLNKQTARYVFRLLAIKEVMENAHNYKFPKVKGYCITQVPAYKVQVDGSIQNLQKFADEQGVTYKALKLMNPWLRSNKLSNPEGKTYYIRLPKNKNLPQFEEAETTELITVVKAKTKLPQENLQQEETVSVQDTLLYTVKNGDNLYDIGKRFGRNADELMKWNTMKNHKLQPGQVLKIYPGKSLENEEL